MIKGVRKNIFPGGNTPLGFYSFYDQIMACESDWSMYILKGGPGTGKSALMKKVATGATDSGFDIEVMICSGDINSIDGVKIPELKVAIIDGTSPHVVDGAVPGARDHIIYLGDYWDEDEIHKYRDKIIELQEDISDKYRRAYNYLAAARTIRNNIDYIGDKALNRGKLNIFTANLIDKFFQDLDVSASVGGERKMFATAITGKGFYGDLASVFQNLRVYALKCDIGDAASYVIDLIKKAAIARGFIVDGYYCPFSPERIEHLVIPKLDIAFTTFNKYHSAVDSDVIYEYPINDCYNDLIIDQYHKEIEYDSFRIDELMERAIRNLAKAGETHRLLEEYYTPYMDFESVNFVTEVVMEEILNKR